MARRRASRSTETLGGAPGWLWAGALVLGGVVLLLFNLDVFVAYEPYVQYGLAGILVLGGLGFFGGFLSQRSHWWRLIPGWTLLALSGMVYLTTIPDVDQVLLASVLFLGQALGFAHIYLLNRSERWWAIIPGGFMLVLSGVIALSTWSLNLELLGSVLFVGLGAVFLLLYLLGSRLRLWWALIPGAVLMIFGLFVFAADQMAENRIILWWPLLLVLLGAAVAWRTNRARSPERLSINQASNSTRRTGISAPQRSDRSEHALSGEAAGPRQQLGDYRRAAPGTSVDVLPEIDEK